MTEFQSETLTKSNERALQSKYVDILCECMKTVTDNITQVIDEFFAAVPA